VGNYSRGMRQRLGLATALIGDPAVLILDEPANGLDPAGIRWMRDLLRGHADRGGTVLLSSHLLSEIEIIADDIVMIGNGRIVSQGSKAELLQAAGTVVRAADLFALKRALDNAGLRSTVSDDGALRTDADLTLVGRIALDARVALTELRTVDGGLEEMFLELTRHPTRREGSMTTITIDPVDDQRTETHQVPVSRVVRVELRKMFDTRSGFWLMASIVISALLTMVATVAFAPDADLSYYTFAKAIGFPMTVVLPMIAILSITGEWSQRTGLTTFTLVPHRNRIVYAKTISSVAVAVASMLFAFVVGAIGNLIGATVAGTELVWDLSLAEAGNIVLGSLLCLLTGTMLGMLIRSSAGALVAYFVYSLLLPTVFGFLAASQGWFRDLQPWVDLNHAEGALFSGTLTGEQWANVAVTTAVWLVLPAVAGLRMVMRSEVK
jgi:hypothetical protein